ncbi:MULTISPECIES: Spy/CpxP family protein refolding chaperone [Reichenbachiella]|uniref:Spy/CpxP family protein refolding chaperone n=1 Tax=Reichenbachiella TaxID=156993 RepID=UPI000E6B99E1|nr:MULTISPECIES: periplasmic heavy metal sensor [Reichenbachiella]MBU2912859.1 periplasmic heavy metal sensor [Reichenbachiella agariperforans]RJE70633.1 hypothetical protein BGP76_11140 [Reichenbachiella sp. MSK19-1]
MKKRIFNTAFMLLVVAGTVLAQHTDKRSNGPKSEMREGKKASPIERLADRLELTPEQTEQVEAIQLKSAKANQSVHNQINELEAKLQTLTTAETPNKKAITNTANQISELKGELFLSKTMAKLEIRSMLNDEQKLKFDRVKGERQGKPKHHN